MYNLGTTIIKSTYTCNTCSTGYFLNVISNICIIRTVKFRQCKTFEVTFDQCNECVVGYYLSPDKTNCIAYPTGIVSCISYTSALFCSQCTTGFYFNGTYCVAVPTGSLVSNCKYYKDDKTCIECIANYALFSNQCGLSQALNCLTWKTSTSCGSCQVGYGIKTQNGLTNCVEIPDKQCVTYVLTFPFFCSVCKKPYYPQDGVCTEVVNTILYCEIYDTATTCFQCDATSILNQQKNKCLKNQVYLNQVDKNCVFMAIDPVPFCNKCPKGYFFFNKTCSKCPDALINSGCYYCDAGNTNSCFMCQSNYFQNSTGGCTKFTVPVINNNNTTPVVTPNKTNITNTTTIPTASETKVKMTVLLCFLVFLSK